MVIEPTLNLTQIAGVFAFFAAAFAAALVALRKKARPGHNARVWWPVAAAHLAFGMEVVMGTRHGLHDYLDDVLRSNGIYPARAVIQVVLLIVCALCFALACSAVRRWLAGVTGLTPYARRSAFVTLAVGALFMVESVSLHAIDQICAMLVIVANAWSEFYAD
jgi:hypothetical protein